MILILSFHRKRFSVTCIIPSLRFFCPYGDLSAGDPVLYRYRCLNDPVPEAPQDHQEGIISASAEIIPYMGGFRKEAVRSEFAAGK